MGALLKFTVGGWLLKLGALHTEEGWSGRDRGEMEDSETGRDSSLYSPRSASLLRWRPPPGKVMEERGRRIFV